MVSGGSDLKARCIFFLLVPVSCAAEPPAGDGAGPFEARPSARQFVGTLTIGPHGTEFLPDEILQHLNDRCAGRPTSTDLPLPLWRCNGGGAEVVSYLVETEALNLRFELPLQIAIASARQQGIRQYGLGLRARLRGRVIPLDEERSGGFTHNFEPTQVISIVPCPKYPQALDRCSN